MARVAIGSRNVAAWSGVKIEVITVVWMVVEAAVAVGAGLVAHSLLLIAFGLDSGIELVSGGILLWRLVVQAQGGTLERVEQAERRAAWVVAVALIGLCLYVVGSAVLGMLIQSRPETAPAGLVVAVVAAVGMPLLARRKRDLAARLDSGALRGDAACSMTCAAMAATLFVGLGLDAAFGWWWAESLASLAFLFWLVPETREALAGARTGKAACACGDDECSA